MTARKAWAAFERATKAVKANQAEEVTRQLGPAVAERRRSAPKGVGKGTTRPKATQAPQRSKYGAVRTADGYASKREAKRAAELRLLQKAGQIRGLREQVRFDLIPAQYEDGKCIERAVTWTADFVYEQEGVGKAGDMDDWGDTRWLTVVEDAKSPASRTQQYIIRRKLMLHVHNIRIREV